MARLREHIKGIVKHTPCVRSVGLTEYYHATYKPASGNTTEM